MLLDPIICPACSMIIKKIKMKLITDKSMIYIDGGWTPRMVSSGGPKGPHPDTDCTEYRCNQYTVYLYWSKLWITLTNSKHIFQLIIINNNLLIFKISFNHFSILFLLTELCYSDFQVSDTHICKIFTWCKWLMKVKLHFFLAVVSPRSLAVLTHLIVPCSLSLDSEMMTSN